MNYFTILKNLKVNQIKNWSFVLKFCVETWQKMSHKQKDQLTDTAQNYFHLLEQFAKLKGTCCMNIIRKSASRFN